MADTTTHTQYVRTRIVRSSDEVAISVELGSNAMSVMSDSWPARVMGGMSKNKNVM